MLQSADFAFAIAADSAVDGLNQSFMAHTLPNDGPSPSASASPSLSLSSSLSHSLSPSSSDSPSPELLLLHNDKFLTHVAHMLNITTESLTNLLTANGTNGTTTTTTKADDSYDESPTLLIVLTICYALIFVAGVLGNLITCIVISRNNFMHTATNFYLFNLAVSDLILLVSGIPQELYNLWCPNSYPFTDGICIVESVLSEMAANATVLTITAFTVERYIAICHPFRQHTMSKLSRAIKFIFAIWLTAFLLALPQAMQFSVVSQDNGGYSCTMENNFYAHVFAVSGFIFFCGPMTAICVLYVLIGIKLKRSRLLQSLPRRAYDANRGLNAQSRVIRMLVAVAVAFFLCWAPFHAQRLMAVYGVSLINVCRCRDAFNDYFHILDYTSGVLYFLSTCINPLLYNIMSHKFREAFKITLTRQFGLARNHQQSQYHQHNYSALMRLQGSMRLQPVSCSNNNNALEPYGSYRVVQFRCRDNSHQLSLQDSIRTNTTTTTINSTSLVATGGGMAGGNNNGCAVGGAVPGRRGRKQDFYATGLPGSAVPQRLLQARLSSLGDVNSHSMLDTEMVDVSRRGNKRTLLATNNGPLLLATTGNTQSEDAQPSTRLKLSRVISRRDETAYSGSSSLPEPETCHSTEATTAGGEVRKFPWRKKRQKQNVANTNSHETGAARGGHATPKSL